MKKRSEKTNQTKFIEKRERKEKTVSMFFFFFFDNVFISSSSDEEICVSGETTSSYECSQSQFKRIFQEKRGLLGEDRSFFVKATKF